MVAERSPRKKEKRKRKEKRRRKIYISHPLLARCPSLSVAVIGARYPVQTGQVGAGGTPPGQILGCDCPQSRRGAKWSEYIATSRSNVGRATMITIVGCDSSPVLFSRGGPGLGSPPQNSEGANQKIPVSHRQGTESQSPRYSDHRPDAHTS